MASPKFDIVIFGASGFTGKYVVAEVARAFMDDTSLTFAVAGRNAQKLQESLAEVQKFHATGHSALINIKKIIANVDNENSLLAMAAEAKVIINCVGPYAYYGDAVVNACIKMKCHHIDISGEQIFLESIVLRYEEKAKAAGLYIVGSCGFDSVPSDLGILYTRNQFNGDLNSVEGYFKMYSTVSGTAGNYGTFASAVNIFRDKSKTYDQSKRLLYHSIPPSKHALEKRREMFYSDEIHGWCHRFPGCDRSVVKRTQYHYYEEEKKRPIQYGVYLAYDGFLKCLLTVIGFLFFMFMCSFRVTRWLMLLFPDILTLGSFSRKGPSRDKVANTTFSLTMVGKGYSTVITDPLVTHTDEPNDIIVTRLTGPEPGYITTPICAVISALLILKEPHKLPQRGGVFTPAAAFANTSIFERMEQRGMVYKVIEAQHHKVGPVS